MSGEYSCYDTGGITSYFSMPYVLSVFCGATQKNAKIIKILLKNSLTLTGLCNILYSGISQQGWAEKRSFRVRCL